VDLSWRSFGGYGWRRCKCKDNGVQKNVNLQDDEVDEIAILPDVKGVWIM
jgi:hypothetical protein